MSDISNVVKGIQGYPVSSTAPTVGQTLVWDGYSYVPTTISSGGVLTKEYFTGDGYWSCPIGVYNVLLIGSGGGGGGGHGSNGSGYGGGSGGGGATQISSCVSVDPGIEYYITIGQGGNGAPNDSSFGDNGGNTTFDVLFTAVGATGGSGQSNLAAGGNGISPYLYSPERTVIANGIYAFGSGGQNANSVITSGSGVNNYPAACSILGFAGGESGTNNSGRFGGAGGGGGPQGIGATGGDAGGSVGSSGNDAGNNTGAGGSGGGEGSSTGGVGGKGGSGFIYIVY